MKYIRILIFFLVFAHVGAINAQEFKYRYKVDGIILHKNMKVIDEVPEEPKDPCLTGEIGTVCETDGAIYVGEIGGVRRYADSSSLGRRTWWAWTDVYNYDFGGSMANVNNAFSINDGEINTNLLIESIYNSVPAEDCRNKGSEWYFPSINEISLITMNLWNEFYKGKTYPYLFSSNPYNYNIIKGLYYDITNNEIKDNTLLSSASYDVICFRKVLK